MIEVVTAWASLPKVFWSRATLSDTAKKLVERTGELATGPSSDVGEHAERRCEASRGVMRQLEESHSLDRITCPRLAELGSVPLFLQCGRSRRTSHPLINISHWTVVSERHRVMGFVLCSCGRERVRSATGREQVQHGSRTHLGSFGQRRQVRDCIRRWSAEAWPSASRRRELISFMKPMLAGGRR